MLLHWFVWANIFLKFITNVMQFHQFFFLCTSYLTWYTRSDPDSSSAINQMQLRKQKKQSWYWIICTNAYSTTISVEYIVWWYVECWMILPGDISNVGWYCLVICQMLGLPSRLGLLNTQTAPLQRGKTPSIECPGYDTKQSDGQVPVMLELWGMQSTPLLPSLLGPLCPGVVAPDKGPIYGLNRTNGILMLNWIVWLNWIAWNRNVFDY